ncbi:MAG: hypothetical protein VX365_03965 [Candidatus Thermoplasmatota archaeon]
MEEAVSSTKEVVNGFLTPFFAVFCFFMVVGTLTADDPWGAVAAVGSTMTVWPFISLIFMLYYHSNGNKDRRKGAKHSLVASLGTIMFGVVFGGILQS